MTQRAVTDSGGNKQGFASRFTSKPLTCLQILCPGGTLQRDRQMDDFKRAPRATSKSDEGQTCRERTRAAAFAQPPGRWVGGNPYRCTRYWSAQARIRAIPGDRPPLTIYTAEDAGTTFGTLGITRLNLQHRNNIKVLGEGPSTLIFSHGFGCDQTMWRYLLDHFASRFKVVMSANCSAPEKSPKTCYGRNLPRKRLSIKPNTN